MNTSLYRAHKGLEYDAEMREWLSEDPYEREKRIKAVCMKCKYRFQGEYSTLVRGGVCNYLGITGHKRPCSPIGCTAFAKGNPKPTGNNPMKRENWT